MIMDLILFLNKVYVVVFIFTLFPKVWKFIIFLNTQALRVVDREYYITVTNLDV